MTAIKKIVIAGGGIAGWMSAAYLNKALNAENPRVEITLLESQESSYRRIGESTIPIIHSFFNFLGIPEQIWMDATKATYNLGTHFKNWNDNGPGDAYWHTFGNVAHNSRGRFSLMHHWLHNWKTGKTDLAFAKAVSESVYLCESDKCPVKAFSESTTKKVPYAYHLDAELLVTFLKDLSESMGINYDPAHLKGVKKDENGFITSLITKEEKEIDGNLFLDCTGGESLLLEKEMGASLKSYADSLICDTVLSVSIPYPENDPYNEKSEGLKPYTTATAMDAGWFQNIPLIGKSDKSYIFSSAHITDEEAEEALRKNLPDNNVLSESRKMRFRSGGMDNHWIKNCIGIGHSAMIIEPMESTRLMHIQLGLQELLFNFPDKLFSGFRMAGFNEKMRSICDEVHEFILLHYTLTSREDTAFWKTIQHDIKIPMTLSENISSWAKHWPEAIIGNNLYGMYNYVSILTGMNHLPEKSHDFLEYYMIEDTFQRFQKVMVMGQNMVNQLGSQADYFKKINRIKEYQNSTF